VSVPALRLSGLAKAYATPVLRGIELTLAAGEVHALVGENGAGKSTLCRIVAGLVPPDAGEMSLGGRRFRPRSRREAEAGGVRIVLQELNLVGTLSVAENLLLGDLPSRFGWIDRRRLRAEARRRLERVGLSGLDPDRPLASLGVAGRQLVQISAALARRCDLLVLDEPTAALSDREAERVFAQIGRVRAEGTAVLYVSHRLKEVCRLADRITVLRDGTVVSSQVAAAASPAELIALMVGREAEASAPGARREARGPALTVEHLRRAPRVRDVSFVAHGGEILGLAGLMGSGRTETLRAIFGADRAQAGQVFVGASRTPPRLASPSQAVRAGLALITEDRQEQGLLRPLSVRANLTLGRLSALAGRLGVVRRAAERATAQAQVDALDVRCASLEQPVGELSGGNQQKVVLGRWLARDPAVLLLDEPTRGVDAGARLEIHRQLRRLADAGKAIVMVSSELEELLLLCDRIAVLSAGTVVTTFERARFDRDAILEAALSGLAARPSGLSA
jgi:ribose transport system ATP-binding protein